MDNSTIWKVIDKYFEDNPQCLVRHHIESYNDFYKNGIFQIFKEKNPIKILTRYDEKIDDHRSQCIMYFGGKDGDKIYFGKPVIYDDDKSHFMFPNEARLRNMTYGMTIHYDIDIEFIDILEEGEKPSIIGAEDIDPDELEKQLGGEDVVELEGGAEKVPKRKGRTKKVDLELTPAEMGEFKEATEKSMIAKNTQKRTITLEKILLGKFPIMLQSNYCVLAGLPKEVRHTMGECSNDLGGYFVIDGKEKTVVSQEKFGDNMLYIKKSGDEKYLYSAEIRSVSENVSKPIRTLSVKIMAPTNKYSFNNIVVNIPNVRSPVPLFIVFRALGFTSDKEIISMCLLDIEKYENMVDLFIPSVHDSGSILTQRNALKFIALLTKGKTVAHALEILCDYFLPHIGENNFKQKAYYLGYIVFRLLSVHMGIEEPTDRDNFKYKRIELVGSLLYDLFREYYTIQQRTIHLEFEKRAHYNQSIYANNLYGLIHQNYKDIFRERIVEDGFKKAFKGNWGAHAHTKRIGILQDLNRLSHNTMLSHLRKTNLPLDATAKVVGPRVLHSTQWGMFDPIDTPDGGNIGLHKHMSIAAYITQGYSRDIIIQWMREKVDMKLIEDCTPLVLSTMTKVFVNGLWVGALTEPIETKSKFQLYRRNGLIPIYTSISFDYRLNTIFIYTDAGRICRPIFYRDEETNKMSFMSDNILQRIEKGEFKWNELISGFNPKKVEGFHPNNNKLFELYELYDNIESESNPAKLKRFLEEKAIIDYVDTNESESAIVALNKETLEKKQHNYTHMEIHESLIFGVMCNLINFPENNPATRNSFSCGQSKQACSMYSTNHRVRMDKTAVVLNNGQNPLVKTRYLEHINDSGNPYGENAIVAVMCYTGYNVEDAILVNEGALKRGLFRTTYYSTYEVHEEKSKSGDVMNQHVLLNIENDASVSGTKPGYDYSKLDKYGIVKVGTELNDRTIVIGMASYDSSVSERKTDMSKTTKKGQLGIVDKTFITEGEEGTRIAKVRVREERIPNIGDKMASRAGQKGTVGLVIPEADMPFTRDGVRPDLIINPHAIPSRMTIGQFVETLTGKACAMYGSYGDCTAYNNNGSKIGVFGEMLTKVGYHSSGNEVLYNGMTGEQLETEIFIGPNYYMRLKHMVKDKINYRALGPRTALTRQPVSGRANDGGLRVGEMERDSIISHGATEFLRESMMERGDKYKMAICNVSGMMAIYNPAKNVFLSPMADGPIKYSGSIDTNIHIDTISKFGRNFSIVEVPYSLKLLMQELLAINVSMRIITEDNIEQLESMSFSNNIDLLLNKKDVHVRDIVRDIKSTLQKETNVDTPLSIEETPVEKKTEDDSPVYNPLSPYHSYEKKETPAYTPYYDKTPEYVVGSPDYTPGTPNYPPQATQDSPSYHPITPDKDSISTVSTDGSIPPPPPPMSETPDNDGEYSTGEIVHYRGDFKPERMWRIIHIGNQFMTIETDDLEGLDNIESTKVVTSIDIYKQGNYPYTSPYSDTVQNNQIMPNQSLDKIPTQTPPTINFAPVFKITNGTNNDNEISDTKQNDDINENMTIPGIKVKTDNKESTEKVDESNNNFFTGGLVIKKSQ
jgi:DNA-directed RNA polymerase II subunit RPB2